MRDIKFRAWDKENRCMVYQEEMNGYIENKQYWFRLNETEVKLNVFDEDYKAYVQTDADIMEYTGLKDINEAEIYEGDIVKISTVKVNEDDYVIGTVAYSEFEGMYVTNKGYILGRVNHRAEVIGNKYENPNLLVNQMKRWI